jgi:hypothetical protein
MGFVAAAGAEVAVAAGAAAAVVEVDAGAAVDALVDTVVGGVALGCDTVGAQATRTKLRTHSMAMALLKELFISLAS